MDILFANPNIFVGENILEESENLHNVDQVQREIGGSLEVCVVCLAKAQWRQKGQSLALRSGLIYLLLLCLLVQPLRVRGCILTLVERMDEEFTKIMQNTDPHSQGKLGQAWTSVRGKVQGVKLRVIY